MVAEDDFNGEQKANLASSIAQVGEPEDMAILVALIHADIRRMTRGAAALASGDSGARAGGSRMSYARWHLSAASLLDPVGFTDVLVGLMPKPYYTVSVAEAMVKSVSVEATPHGDGISEYRRIWDARDGRLGVSAVGMQGKQYATAVAEHIERLTDEPSHAEQPGSNHTLICLANALAALDGRSWAPLVLKTLSLAGDYNDWSRIGALERLLASGVVPSTEVLIALVDRVVERSARYGLQDDDKDVIVRYLCLLAYVDDPSRGIQKVRTVLTHVPLAPYRYREIATALGESRSDAVVDALREFGANQGALRDYAREWVNAVATLDTPDSRRLLLGFVDPAAEGLDIDMETESHGALSARIANVANRDAVVADRLHQLADTELPPLKRKCLAAVLRAIGTPESLVAGLKLIDDRAQPPVPHDTFSHLEGTLIELLASGQSGNSYTPAARASNDVRATLFEMAYEDTRRQKSALRLLGEIERWRLEYGRPVGEPRHPAFRSGRRWPPI